MAINKRVLFMTAGILAVASPQAAMALPAIISGKTGAIGEAAGIAAPSPAKSLLGKASDAALDKLAVPGTFYGDEAVRILLPGPLKQATGILKFTSKAGLTNDLVKSINDAAGLAAKEAKPVFRDAIDKMTLTDAVSIAKQGDGATQYLRESSGDTLKGKLRPLITSALGTTGALNQISKINKVKLVSSLGLGPDMLIDSVTDQALSGIFSYLGNEERALRANPLGAGTSLLKGLIK